MSTDLEVRRQAFEDKGLKIIASFMDDSRFVYVLYHMSEFNPAIFVTGDRFDWETGLRWEPAIRQIVRDYWMEEPIKLKIERMILDTKDSML